MSAGKTITTVYETGAALYFPIRIQPETLTFTLNGVANTASTNEAGLGLPSATVSRGRRSNGVNTRLVRFRFTNVLPPGYLENGVIALPVLQNSVYVAYSKSQTGTYTINGTEYEVEFVGKSPETVR